MNATGGNWNTVQVAGHPVECYAPAVPSEHGYVVIYLHGVHLGRLEGNDAFEREFDRYGLRVIVPQTKRSWWSDRICPEFDESITAERHVLDNVLPYVAATFGTEPPGIALLGTSMGGQGALRFAFKHPNVFPVVAALSPAIDYQFRYDDEHHGISVLYEDEEAARQDTATLHVHPLNWPRHVWFACDPTDEPWYSSADKLAMKLSALGIPHETDMETIAGGHGFGYYNHMADKAIAFIHERLEKERLRIV